MMFSSVLLVNVFVANEEGPENKRTWMEAVEQRGRCWLQYLNGVWME